ncbi:NAD-dependent epimerase/dehydratase family protein [Tunicatimonas pelagia]|uniref:NAD-dependent epimerase/dehydratase family protein n=1 Tax=Tunicatimonas pelagia TaxID=931531 RepID=UPI002666A821|nr:NAD-dependent epimerase/dehydratase family protein [Tunicatimonas pelagia]WKN44769.1 NAD-dependent epimerase/dehydratase family protein [Tunicatimonas pelagia]
MKVIITGATGMIGKGVLLECLDHEAISKVLVIGRNSVGMTHPKLNEILHQDFSDFTPLATSLIGYDACYYSLGISAAGLSEEQYRTITYEYTIALAEVLHKKNPEMTFIFVSGQGTDSSGTSSLMWARVKGQAENDLLEMGFKQAFMFRPGVLMPLRGIKSRTKSYQFLYDYFMWLVKAIRALVPNYVVSTTQIGLAMIQATVGGYEKTIIAPKDMIILANRQLAES